MITSSQVERLVRKITDVMEQPAPDASAGKLAEEYAEISRTANRRLEQCALMIEAGQSLQALQLAETPPSLLDLITVLNFRQSSQWRTFCQSHQLPWAEPFYDKSVRLLNSAYGKGIAADHSYYRDYRRAVLKKDDVRALSILRVIAKMNPADENTRSELKRVEEKILRVKLEKLREAVAAGDNAAIQEHVRQIEISGASVPPTHAVWQQAQAARCHDLLQRAEEFRRTEDWQSAETLVEEIHTVATHYHLQLPAAEADGWSALDTWTGEHRRGFAEEQDYQRAVGALEHEIQTLKNRQAKGERFRIEDATRHFNLLSNKLNDARRFDRPLAEDLVIEAGRLQGWLQDRIRIALRNRRIIAAVAVVVALMAIGATIPFIQKWARERSILDQFATLQSDRRVSDTEALIGSVPASLTAKPPVAAAIATAQDFLTRERDVKKTFDQTMGGLQALARSHFQNVAEAGSGRIEAERELAALAPEFQTEARKTLQGWDEQWQAFRNQRLASELKRAEDLAGNLKSGSGFESVNTALSQMEPILSGTAPLQVEPPALDENLQGRLHDLTAKMAQWRGHADHWQKLSGLLANAQNSDEYFDRVDQLVQSPFATAAQRDAASELDGLKINQETLPGELLLPNDRSLWPTLTNASAWRTALMPEQPTPREKDEYFKLRDDKSIRNVFLYQLVTNARPNNPFHSHAVFVQGSIALDRGGQMAGSVFDPELYHDTAIFLPETFSDWDFINIIKTNRSPESESFDRLGLGDLIDPNTGNYEKPILQFLDQLNRDDNSSAIFRAYVALRLFAIANLRPNEWGLQWCPGAAQELQALKDLGAVDLKSGDWMVRAPVEHYEAALEKYFAQARQVPLEKQAAFLEQLTRQSCQTDFSFAGYVDVDGHPVVHRVEIPAMDYWGWSATAPTATLLLSKPSRTAAFEKRAEPMPFSPLYVFNGDRRKLLSNIAHSTAYPPAQMSGVLPPLFRGLYE